MSGQQAWRRIVLGGAATTLLAGSAAATGAVDRKNVSALGVANRFLNAWQMRAGAEGLSLASPRLRQKVTDKALRTEIFGLSNPHHLAYEVSSAWSLSPSRFSVRVRLYEEYTGYERPGPRPPQWRMVLVRTENGDWKVDELPHGPVPAKRGGAALLSPDYGSALAVADRFLNAWRNRADADGLALASTDLKRKRTEAQLRAYLRGLPGLRHEAYEIYDGWTRGGRYTFGARLYELDGNKRLRTTWMQIVLVKPANGSWKVDDIK